MHNSICETREIRDQRIDEWPAPSSHPVLGPDDVHLWRVSLNASDVSLHEFARTLSADERHRADCFRFEVHRRRFIVGRGVLRALLGQYVGQAPAALAFAYGPHGKPALTGSRRERGIFFNASGSDEFALMAVTRIGEIGVDLEHLRPVPEWREIAGRLLAADHDVAPPATPAEFFRAWTRHEAGLKAAGLGLGGAWPPGPAWELRSLLIDPDLVAALALPEGVRHVAGWSWGNHCTAAGRNAVEFAPTTTNPQERVVT